MAHGPGRAVGFAVLLGLSATAGEAQTTLYDDARACADPALDPDDFVREEVTTLTEEGMFTIEYSCVFGEPIAFDWSHGEPIVRAGYCMEPGPYVYPTVFVVGLWPGEDGVARVWQQGAEPAGEAVVFEVCGE